MAWLDHGHTSRRPFYRNGGHFHESIILCICCSSTMHQHQQQPQSGSRATAELQQILSTPPHDLPPHQQHNTAAIAHAQLQSLRDTGDSSFLFVRSILELATKSFSVKLLPQEEELLFHCITGCRHVLLMKWNSFSLEYRRGLRDYFLALGTQATMAAASTSSGVPTKGVSRTVRLAYFNASASFWKRSWVNDLQQELPQQQHQQPQDTTSITPHEQSLLDQMAQSWQAHQSHPLPRLESSPSRLFAHLQHMLLHEAPPLQLAATSYLIVLLGEFAGGKSVANYNLPLEFHKRAHTVFELGVDPTSGGMAPLNDCLHMSMTALSQLVPAMQNNTVADDVALSIVQLAIDVIGWEWGTDAWDTSAVHHTSSALVRPPAQWRDVLLQPDFIRAMFQIHHAKLHASSDNSKQQQQQQQQESREQLLHGIRQLLLLLTSLTGPMFDSTDERKQLASLLLEGILGMLQTPGIDNAPADLASNALLIDTFSMTSRLFVNYKLSTLVQLPNLSLLFQKAANLGRQLLQDNLHELQSKAGDFELMEHREWREEALAVLVEGLVLMCGDPWLLYSGSEEFRRSAQGTLAQTLGPLYVDFIKCRTQMARLEEMYIMAHETELDEVREEIFAVDLEEEMTALAQLGRLDLHASINCLVNLFQQIMPQVQHFWDGNVGVVTPEAAGLLEEARLVTVYVGHLLTDDNEGETPVIPDSVLAACQDTSNGSAVTQAIQGAVQTLLQFAHFQATKIAQYPGDPRLSPLLAKSFLWFLHRWAPAYILPVDYGALTGANSIVKVWASPEAVQESMSFAITLSLHYHCYWPHEPQVQENATLLLHAMARRCRQMRLAMVATPSFRQLISFHCLTSSIRHSAPPAETESIVRTKSGNTAASLNLDMLRGYQRLPYIVKSKILTALLVGCSEHSDETSKSLLHDCLGAIHEAFSSLVHALSYVLLAVDMLRATNTTPHPLFFLPQSFA